MWLNGLALNAMADEAIVSPAIVVVGRECRARPLASRTADATFNSPAPCSMTPAPASRPAVTCSANFTCAGFSAGFASSSRAAAPATTAADWLVPLSVSVRQRPLPDTSAG